MKTVTVRTLQDSCLTGAILPGVQFKKNGLYRLFLNSIALSRRLFLFTEPEFHLAASNVRIWYILKLLNHPLLTRERKKQERAA